MKAIVIIGPAFEGEGFRECKVMEFVTDKEAVEEALARQMKRIIENGYDPQDVDLSFFYIDPFVAARFLQHKFGSYGGDSSNDAANAEWCRVLQDFEVDESFDAPQEAINDYLKRFPKDTPEFPRWWD